MMSEAGSGADSCDQQVFQCARLPTLFRAGAARQADICPPDGFAFPRRVYFCDLRVVDFLLADYFRESLSDANLDVIEALEEFEQEAMLNANQQRVAFEKKIRAPDDYCLDVAKHEEELRDEGEPSPLGLIFSTRRFTREEIMRDTFGDDDETDDEDESDMD